jgi:hypothetical protein
MNGQLPVFRTETQDRMLKSAQNFAAGMSWVLLTSEYADHVGFFGIPAEDQYNLEVMIEAPGFNCTLAPWNAVRLHSPVGVVDEAGADGSAITRGSPRMVGRKSEIGRLYISRMRGIGCKSRWTGTNSLSVMSLIW